MKWLVGVIGLSIGLNVFAGAIISTQVKEIDHALGREKQTLIFLADGTVAKVNREEKDFIKTLSHVKKRGSWLDVSLNDNREIESVASIPKPKKHSGPITVGPKEDDQKYYGPTVISSYEKALAIYKGLNRRYQDESQCYNRAHIWSWEMLTKHQVHNMKVFMFFHRKYIRRYNFEWWFHIAPYVLVREGDKVVERVMDYRYTRNPVTMKEWTDVFMHNNAECETVTKYTDYEYTRDDSSKPWCYLLRTNPYYYQPVDMEAQEKKGKEKDYWVEWELNNAFKEAFGI